MNLKNLSPYATAEPSTKALASKAFLVNHAKFEALRVLEKIIFTNYEEGAMW